MVLSCFWGHVHSCNPYEIGVPGVFNEHLLLEFLFQTCPARLPFPLAGHKFVPGCDFQGEWSMRELSDHQPRLRTSPG